MLNLLIFCLFIIIFELCFIFYLLKNSNNRDDNKVEIAKISKEKEIIERNYENLNAKIEQQRQEFLNLKTENGTLIGENNRLREEKLEENKKHQELLKNVEENNGNLKEKIDKQQEELLKLKTDNSSLITENQKNQEKFQIIENANDSLKVKLEQQQEELLRLKTENGTLIGENNRLKEEKQEENKKIQEHFQNQFKIISNEIIREQKQNFTEEQKNILDPFKNDLKLLNEKITMAEKGSTENTAKLDQKIKDLIETTTNIGDKADKLATALKGDKKQQGNWGEATFENLLQSIGMQKGLDYETQYYIKDKNGNNITDNDGNKFYLDFLIKLPHDKVLIADSKVSLNNYCNYIDSNDAKEKEKYLKLFYEDIRKHITELSDKKYQDVYKNNNKNDTPDFVFMFFAIENAYIQALQFNKNLIDYALSNKVCIVTYSSFSSVLKMIKYLWDIESQNKNISDIIQKVKLLLDKVNKFNDKMLNIKKGIDNLSKNYDEAHKYLYDGKANITKLSTDIENLKEKKNIQYIDSDNIEYIE